MDVLLQNHGSKRVFPIPEGLKELTSDIIREVLRHQPECIHSFIAEYLETMVIVREKARDSAIVVSNVFRQGYFFEDLYRTKNVKREQAEAYASVIQAGWRGYVIRKKFRDYLQKRRKMQEDRERKKTMKIEQYLESIGITYEEATRAACIIQAAYRQSRRCKWVINEAGEEVWMEGQTIPFGQRVREADKLQGRCDRWEKKDWGDFFEMDEEGEIHHDWPRVGQLFKIPRDLLTPDMEVVRFYGMRDLEGKEQYTYLKGPQKGRNPRGFPIGFLIPLPRGLLHETSAEVTYLDNESNERMGTYTYVYEKAVERPDLDQFAAILRDRKMIEKFPQDIEEEYEYDPDWVLPRILIQTRKDCLRESDDEVAFVKEELAPEIDDFYTFRAETADLSLKVIDRILKSSCSDLEEAMAEAGYLPTYKQAMAGRFLAAEIFQIPKYIQRVVIQKESKKGEYENKDLDQFEYVFVPRKYKWPKKRAVKPENPIKIPLTRFQGYRTNYRGSDTLDKKTHMFIMGPMMYTPDGKPLTYHSIFWDFFGPESWYQLLCKIAERKIALLGEAAPEEQEEEQEEEEEEEEVEASEEIEEIVKAAEESAAEQQEETVSESSETVTPLAAVDQIEKKETEPEATPEDLPKVQEPEQAPEVPEAPEAPEVPAVEGDGEEKPAEEEAAPHSEAEVTPGDEESKKE